MSISRVTAADSQSIRTALGDARSVLLLASDDAGETCASLLSPADSHLLCVTLDGPPDARLDELRAHLGELPAETGVIAVGESTRSATAAEPTAQPSGPSLVTVDTVADPSDLTGLAMAIGAHLDAWSAPDTTPVICFDSITALLFHTEKERVFRFLHATTGRLRDVGARAHYHLNPEAYDEATVNTFSALFDAVVNVEADDTVSVNTRR